MRRVRIAAAAASLLLLVASCNGGSSGDGDPVEIGGGVDAGQTTTTTSTGGGGEGGTPSSTSAAPDGGPGTTASGGPGRPGPGSSTTVRAGAGRTTTSQADPVRSGQGGVGSFARTILRPGVTGRVLVERLQQSGVSLRGGTVSHAQETLSKVVQKPVTVSDPVAIPGSGEDWTAERLRSLADEHTKSPNGGDVAVIHVLVLRGEFEGTDDTLGVAVRGDVLAIFPDVIRSHAPADRVMNEVEAAVLVHELGHILGLVDLARDTGRDDPEHPGHSRSDRSVMFWAIESDQVFLLLTGPPPRDFDAADLADLAALRDGK